MTTIHEEGRQAYLSEKGEGACPYNDQRRTVWLEGWREARDQSEAD